MSFSAALSLAWVSPGFVFFSLAASDEEEEDDEEDVEDVDVVDVAAWTMVISMLMNFDEVVRMR